MEPSESVHSAAYDCKQLRRKLGKGSYLITRVSMNIMVHAALAVWLVCSQLFKKQMTILKERLIRDQPISGRELINLIQATPELVNLHQLLLGKLFAGSNSWFKQYLPFARWERKNKYKNIGQAQGMVVSFTESEKTCLFYFYIRVRNCQIQNLPHGFNLPPVHSSKTHSQFAGSNTDYINHSLGYG